MADEWVWAFDKISNVRRSITKEWYTQEPNRFLLEGEEVKQELVEDIPIPEVEVKLEPVDTEDLIEIVEEVIEKAKKGRKKK